jgi:hypothetical protein
MTTKRTPRPTTMTLTDRYLEACRMADESLRRALSIGIDQGLPTVELGALIRQLERVTSRVERTRSRTGSRS